MSISYLFSGICSFPSLSSSLKFSSAAFAHGPMLLDNNRESSCRARRKRRRSRSSLRKSARRRRPSRRPRRSKPRRKATKVRPFSNHRIPSGKCVGISNEKIVVEGKAYIKTGVESRSHPNRDALIVMDILRVEHVSVIVDRLRSQYCIFSIRCGAL